MYEPAVPIKNAEQYHINDALFYPALTSDSILWMGTFDRGLILYDLVRNREVQSFTHQRSNPFSLQANNVTTLRLDDDNLLWIGTEAGLSLLNPRNQSLTKTYLFHFNDDVLTDNYIVNIFQDPDHPEIAWILCLGQGILKFDWKSKKLLSQYKKIGNTSIEAWREAVYDMIRLRKNEWLLVRRNNLLVWNEKTGSASVITSSVGNSINFSTAAPALDYVYITSQQGLFRYNHLQRKLEHVFAPERGNQNLYSGSLKHAVYDASLKKVWAASHRGLVCFDEKSGRTKVL